MTDCRNQTLDVIKLIASYMVIFIHVLFFGNLGILMGALARFAVPLFFAISGFFSYACTAGQIRKRIIHILRLLIVAVTVYFFWNVLQLIVFRDTQGLIRYFGKFLDIQSLLRFFVLNEPLFTEHLWYLYAILYVYILYYLVIVFNVPRLFVFTLSFLLLAVHIVLGEGLAFFGILIPVSFLRNFALMGIPFFGLGLLASAYKEQLRSIPNYTAAVCLALGILETGFSRFFIGQNELYIGSVLILLAMILLFIKYPDAQYPPAWIALGSCSTYIYIFHPIVAAVIRKLYLITPLNYQSSAFLQMVHPLLVCICSTLLAHMLNRLTKQWKI